MTARTIVGVFLAGMLAMPAPAVAGQDEFAIEPVVATARPGETVDLKSTPPLRVGRDELLATVGGVDAVVDSVAGDRVRVKVPALPAGIAQVRLSVVTTGGTPALRSAYSRLTITEAKPWHAWTARALVSVLVALILAGLYHATPKRNANRWNRLMFLVYDDRTDSYSVKQLQAVLWFGTVLPIVLFAFVYTQLSAGVGTWIQIPENILLLLGTSAATVVAAEGLERARQPPVKSAAKQASWRDLFQEGERFSFPRFQVVCWTVVTCGFLIATYWNRAEANPSTLPDIPRDFWLLMGLSAATYVGGKVVDSGPGAPKVLSAVVTPTRTELIMRVSNPALRFDLKPEGWFTISGTDVKGAQVTFPLDPRDLITQQIDTVTYRMVVPMGRSGSLPSQSGGSKTLDLAKPVTIHLTNSDGQLSADIPVTC